MLNVGQVVYDYTNSRVTELLINKHGLSIVTKTSKVKEEKA